jgi:hypothetical protein
MHRRCGNPGQGPAGLGIEIAQFRMLSAAVVDPLDTLDHALPHSQPYGIQISIELAPATVEKVCHHHPLSPSFTKPYDSRYPAYPGETGILNPRLRIAATCLPNQWGSVACRFHPATA